MQIDLNKIYKSPFAILVWYKQENKEDEVKVYSGFATWKADSESVEIYRDGTDKPALILSGEQLNRINIVTDNMKDMLLNADYGISLTMTNLSTNDTDTLNLTGFKW